MRLTTFLLLADPQLGPDVKLLSNLNNELNNIQTREFPLNGKDISLINCKGFVNKPDAVFFAGDLTSFGGNINVGEWMDADGCNAATYEGGAQLQDVRALYDPVRPRNGITQLSNCGPLYFGLGNHDLENNTYGMPPWRLYDGNGESDSFDYYRFQMWNYIDQMHIGYHQELHNAVRNVDARFPIAAANIDSDPLGTSYYKDYSFNYVIDLGPVDVYQLHQFGGDSTFGRKSGLDWLKRKLAIGGYSRPVIIVQHISVAGSDSDYGFTPAVRDKLLAILRPYNVIAMLVGHSHSTARVREVRPSTGVTIDGVRNNHQIWELRPGAATLEVSHTNLDGTPGTRFGLVRVEEPDAGNEVITNVVYGTVRQGKTKFEWQYGWSNRTSTAGLYLLDIEVIYRDTEADDAADDLPWYVTEETSKSANINHGFGGRHVYIKPILTANALEAATGFDLAIRDQPYEGPNARIKDLAKGAGGKYRYLVPKREPGKTPIRQLWLWRADGRQAPRLGWEMTGDINKGRGGDYLLLEWDARG